MRILFDTNIFIYRENHTILTASLQNLHKVLNNWNHAIELRN